VDTKPTNSAELHRACEGGVIEEVKAILKRKANVNAPQEDDLWTPLHCAANAKNLEVCRLLLKSGADPSLRNNTGATPMHYLVRCPYSTDLHDVLKLFLEKGASVQTRNSSEMTPLHEVALKGSPETAEFLVKHGANVNSPDKRDETPLHHAARKGGLEMVEMLLDLGADASVMGYKGRASDVARSKDLSDFILNYVCKPRGEARFRKTICSRIAPVCLARSVQEFPDSYRKYLPKINQEQLDKNFGILSNVLYFNFHLQPIPLQRSDIIREENPYDLYHIGQAIGESGFGKVYQAKDKATDTQVAIKKVAHSHYKQMISNYNEVYILSRFDHPNIIRLLAAYEIEEDIGRELWLVTEFVDGCSLRMLSKKVALKEPAIGFIVKQLVSVLSYIHNLKMVYRDLKAANVMVSVSGDIKLVDFGLSIREEKTASVSIAGSAYWLAPEIIAGRRWGSAVDVWSLGMVLLEVVQSRTVFKFPCAEHMFRVATGDLSFIDLPDEWRGTAVERFVGCCLRFNPEERDTVDRLAQQPLLESAMPRLQFEDMVSRALAVPN